MTAGASTLGENLLLLDVGLYVASFDPCRKPKVDQNDLPYQMKVLPLLPPACGSVQLGTLLSCTAGFTGTKESFEDFFALIWGTSEVKTKIPSYV